MELLLLSAQNPIKNQTRVENGEIAANYVNRGPENCQTGQGTEAKKQHHVYIGAIDNELWT